MAWQIDQGYVTVYYPFAGGKIWLPRRDEDHPSREHLEWHADTVFLG